MGERIFDLLKSFATGKQSKIFWGILIVVLISAVLIFPYIDANFLYYSRIEKKIDNLTELVALSGKPLEDSPVLLTEYNNIINEIKDAQEKSITSLVGNKSDSAFEYWVKFAGGTFLFALVGVIVLFQNIKDVKISFLYFLKNNLLVFVLCVIFSGVLGVIFSKVPTLGSPWVNFFVAPIAQLAVIYLLFLKQ